MTHPTDDGPALKPSDEARRLVEAYGLEQYFLGQEGIVHGDKDPTAEALLAYIARLEASMPIDQAAALVREISRLKRALEATPQNAGEAKPVAQWRYALGQGDASGDGSWLDGLYPGDPGSYRVETRLLYAAPPHADLVAEERERIAQIFENWIAPTISLKDAAFAARHVVARTDEERGEALRIPSDAPYIKPDIAVSGDEDVP